MEHTGARRQLKQELVERAVIVCYYTCHNCALPGQCIVPLMWNEAYPLTLYLFFHKPVMTLKKKKKFAQFAGCLLLGPPGFNCWFSFAPVFQWCCSTPQGSPGVVRNTFLSSPHLCFITVFICDYLFHVMIHWWVRKPPLGPNNCMFWAMIETEGEVGYP